MDEKEKLESFKKFWQNKTAPHHSHGTEDWFDKYYKEILFYVHGYKSIADVGCGSGEFLIRFANDFEEVVGFDMSPSMVAQTEKKIKDAGLKNISISCADANQIDEVLKKKVDVIFNYGVVQYLNKSKLEDFIGKCAPLLNENGMVILMSIPNYNMELLYYNGLYKKTEEKIGAKDLLKKIKQFNFMLWKKRLRNPSYEYEPQMGFWYSMSEIRSIAEQHGFDAEFFYMIYPPYGYRFNARLTRKKLNGK